MPPIVPTEEPLSVVAGDTVTWRRSLIDFPASAGWSLTYYMLGPSPLSISSTADGDDHVIYAPPATTAAWPPGTYTWNAYATLGGDRYLAASGQIVVLVNLATAITPARSSFRIQLAAVQAVLEGTSTYSQRVVEINGKRLDRHSLVELMHVQNVLLHRVQMEDDAARVAAGLPSRSSVLVRFA